MSIYLHLVETSCSKFKSTLPEKLKIDFRKDFYHSIKRHFGNEIDSYQNNLSTVKIGTFCINTFATLLLIIPWGLIAGFTVNTVSPFFIIWIFYGFILAMITDLERSGFSSKLKFNRTPIPLSFFYDIYNVKKVCTKTGNNLLVQYQQEIKKESTIEKFRNESGLTKSTSEINFILNELKSLRGLKEKISEQINKNQEIIKKLDSTNLNSEIKDKVVLRVSTVNNELKLKLNELTTVETEKTSSIEKFNKSIDEIENCWLLLDAANCVEFSTDLIKESEQLLLEIESYKEIAFTELKGLTTEVSTFLNNTLVQLRP